jgi:hypothetical protein
MVNTLRRSEDDFSSALERRARLHRRARLAVLAAVVGYFFLPYEVQAVIPVWLLFLAALGLEVEFFVGGWLQARQGVEPAPVDRGPQPRDLEELGAQYDEYEPLSLFPTDWYSEPAAAAPHRQWRYLAEAAAGLAIVAVILYFAVRPSGWDAVSSANQAKAETVFSREASLIAGHPAQITCDTSGQQVGIVQDADGRAEVGGRQAYLTPSICDTLYQLAFKDRVQSFARTARAIAVLGHEAQHLRGVRNEGLANCYGFQSGVGIGVNLGLSESRARAMMREQLATNASDAASNPQYLVPSGCRDGGPYDLSPSAADFP